MADSVLVEGVKFFGGLAGLGLAAFTIYDRMVRNRVDVSLTALVANDWPMPQHMLRVRNPSRRDIMVGPVKTSNENVRVLPDRSFRTSVPSDFDLPTPVAIPPQSERLFYIHVHEGNFLPDEKLIPVTVMVRWRTTGRRWGGIPVKLKTSNKELKDLATDAERSAKSTRRSG